MEEERGNMWREDKTISTRTMAMDLGGILYKDE